MMGTKSRTKRKRIIIYGAGTGGRRAAQCLPRNWEVVAVADDDPAKANSLFAGYPVVSVSQLPGLSYDMIVIASLTHAKTFYGRLMSLCVSPDDVYMFQRNVLLTDRRLPWRALTALGAVAIGCLSLLATVLWIALARASHD